VRTLFLDVICAGSEKKNTSHLLKPLALEVLKEMSQALVDDPSEDRRLGVVKALLNCELRFDARTKTTTVSSLLQLTKPVQDGNLDSKISFWNQHLEHLLSCFFSECSTTQDDQTSAKATGYVELIYSFAKHVLRLQTDSKKEQSKLDDFKSSVADKVLKFFMASAFFNCENISETKTPKKKKGKNPKKENENPMQSIASRLKQTHAEGAGVGHPVRLVISARFFSLLADFSAYMTHALVENSEDKVEKDSTTLSVLVKMTDSWESLGSLGAKRFAAEAKNMNDEDYANPENIISEIQGLLMNAADGLSKDPEDVMAYSNKRCCTGIAVLAYALYLHRLTCGEGGQESDDPDADPENDEEEICSSLESLKDVAVSFVKKTVDESNPLSELAEICANLLSSPLGSGNMGRAASPKLIREAIKFAWLGGLRRASNLANENGGLFDASVARALLDAVGAAEETEEVEEDGSDDEMDDADDETGSHGSMEDDRVFTKAMDVDDDDDEDLEETKKTGRDDGEESDVELDPTKLQSMLEEDSDADGDEGILEHHEGADAALAKLIRLRQETRKAGKQAREKIELAHQLRCTFLLELLFGRPDSWNRLFETEILLDIILPILRYRKKLERSLKRSLEGGDKSGENGKQALLDRLTSILNQKICKLKIGSLPSAKPLDAEPTLEYTTKVLGEARRAASKEQSSCCSTALVFVLRSSSDPFVVSELLKEAVSDWSTKRTTKLEAILFDDLITHFPVLSSSLLVDPLAQACDKARSPFLKAESFRLLTSSFATHSNEMSQSFLPAVESALQDEEMRKAKRVRVVLKALEKYIAGLGQASSKTVNHLDRISTELTQLAEGESQGVSAICRKLLSDLETKKAEFQVQTKESTVAEIGESDVSAKKKKKKKKKR
jgi:DNA polymerase phi